MRLLLPLLLAGCASFPALDARLGPEGAGPPPALVPLGPVLLAADALAAPAPGGLAAAGAALGARAGALDAAAPDAGRLGALRGRADDLRGAGLSDEERDRLADGPGPAPALP